MNKYLNTSVLIGVVTFLASAQAQSATVEELSVGQILCTQAECGPILNDKSPEELTAWQRSQEDICDKRGEAAIAFTKKPKAAKCIKDRKKVSDKLTPALQKKAVADAAHEEACTIVCNGCLSALVTGDETKVKEVKFDQVACNKTKPAWEKYGKIVGDLQAKLAPFDCQRNQQEEKALCLTQIALRPESTAEAAYRITNVVLFLILMLGIVACCIWLVQCDPCYRWFCCYKCWHPCDVCCPSKSKSQKKANATDHDDKADAEDDEKKAAIQAPELDQVAPQ